MSIHVTNVKYVRAIMPLVITRANGEVLDCGIVSATYSDPIKQRMYDLYHAFPRLRFLQKFFEPKRYWNSKEIMKGDLVIYRDDTGKDWHARVLSCAVSSFSIYKKDKKTGNVEQIRKPLGNSNNCITLHIFSKNEKVPGVLYDSGIILLKNNPNDPDIWEYGNGRWRWPPI